jgi:excinuclease UvrABC ATPase subunit
VTGLSGSGKSSLAFDTIYAEGQRRYMESLSSYAKRFIAQVVHSENGKFVVTIITARSARSEIT